MAIFHLNAQIIGRSAGRSAVAAAAYRSGEKLIDARTGLVHDFTRKRGVEYSEIMTPSNAPEWTGDRQELWDHAEAVERRKDAQVAREINLALPCELDAGARLELIRGFVRSTFVEAGMIADLSIHAPESKDDRNHHAHIMLSLRSIDAAGFGAKVREWNASDLLVRWRERWASAANAALEQTGCAERIDHRSLEAQGADRAPGAHLGPIAAALEARGILTLRGDLQRAAAAEQVVDLAAERERRQARTDALVERNRRRLAAERAEREQQRAASDPGRAVNGPAATKTDEIRAEIDPAEATTTTNRAGNDPDRAAGGPQEEAHMNISARERDRLSMPLEFRLNAQIPGRFELVTARHDYDQKVAILKRDLGWATAAKKQLAAHPFRATLGRLGVGKKWVDLVREAAGFEALQKRKKKLELKARDITKLAALVAASEVKLRPGIEAQFKLDRARLEAFMTNPKPAAPEPAPGRSIYDPARVAAFESGRIDRPGPEHAYQSAFDAARAAGLVAWPTIAIRGTAAALEAGNKPKDCIEALAAIWPGSAEDVQKLVREGQIQRLVDQVRETIEADLEPMTPAGAALVAALRGARDDEAARVAIGMDFNASRLAFSADPGLRLDQDRDRPAPRPE